MKLSRLLRSEDARQTLDLTLRLTQRSVSSEFKGTALGRLWSFINPLATIAIFALIFGVVFRGGVEPGRNSGINSFALWIGIGVLSWTFFSSGIMASMNALVFRDLGHLWQIFNQMWMYASGVVFPLTMVNKVQNDLFDKGWQVNGGPIPLTTILRLNPAETYLEAFRSCLYDFALPSQPVFLACLAWAIVMLTLGLVFFRRHSASIVEEL